MKLSELPTKRHFYVGNLDPNEDATQQIQEVVARIYLETDKVLVKKQESQVPIEKRRTSTYCVTVQRDNTLTPIPDTIFTEFATRFPTVRTRQWKGTPITSNYVKKEVKSFAAMTTGDWASMGH